MRHVLQPGPRREDAASRLVPCEDAASRLVPDEDAYHLVPGEDASFHLVPGVRTPPLAWFPVLGVAPHSGGQGLPSALSNSFVALISQFSFA